MGAKQTLTDTMQAAETRATQSSDLLVRQRHRAKAGAMIRSLRTDRGWTPSELGKRMGLWPTGPVAAEKVHRLERGRIPYSPLIQKAVRDALSTIDHDTTYEVVWPILANRPLPDLVNEAAKDLKAILTRNEFLHCAPIDHTGRVVASYHQQPEHPRAPTTDHGVLIARVALRANQRRVPA